MIKYTANILNSESGDIIETHSDTSLGLLISHLENLFEYSDTDESQLDWEPCVNPEEPDLILQAELLFQFIHIRKEEK